MMRRKQLDMFYFKAVCESPPYCQLSCSEALERQHVVCRANKAYGIPQYDIESLRDHAAKTVDRECSRILAKLPLFVTYNLATPRD